MRGHLSRSGLSATRLSVRINFDTGKDNSSFLFFIAPSFFDGTPQKLTSSCAIDVFGYAKYRSHNAGLFYFRIEVIPY